MTPEEYEARGTPVEARVKAVMGCDQGGTWRLEQGGYCVQLDDIFDADTLRRLADALDGRDPVAGGRIDFLVAAMDKALREGVFQKLGANLALLREEAFWKEFLK